MTKILLLAGVIIVKILIAKGIALACILLSAWIKSIQLNRSSVQWDKFFLSLKEPVIISYTKTIYLISTTLSTCLIFILFKLLNFIYPIFLTVIIEIICVFISWYKYKSKGKNYIKTKLSEVKESIEPNNTSNDITS